MKALVMFRLVYARDAIVEILPLDPLAWEPSSDGSVYRHVTVERPAHLGEYVGWPWSLRSSEVLVIPLPPKE